jgi:hypothetical protein
MRNLRDRLRAADPAEGMRLLDPDELAAMRRAMATARPAPRRFPLVVGAVAAVATGMMLAVLLWPADVPPPAVPAVEAAAPLPSAPAPPALAEIRQPRRRAVRPAVPAPITPAAVREIRYVTASGTQILWTFRSSEEGA